MNASSDEIESTSTVKAVSLGDISNLNIFYLVFVLFIAFIIARAIAYYFFGTNRFLLRRRNTLLLGLCGSGKTTLFAQLVAQKRIGARTSMTLNRGTMTRATQNNVVSDANVFRELSAALPQSKSLDAPNLPITVVDYPGHRRLRDSLAPALEEAKYVVLVVDSVTIHDDRNEGAQALAEFVISTFSSPFFYGVQRVLVACTKRDELTSYSSRAVRKLLEAEITRCIITRQGDLQGIDNVVDSAGATVGVKRHGAGAGRSFSAAASGAAAYQLSLGASGKFTFDDFDIPVHFADISSMVDPKQHSFNVEPVWEFVAGLM